MPTKESFRSIESDKIPPIAIEYSRKMMRFTLIDVDVYAGDRKIIQGATHQELRKGKQVTLPSGKDIEVQIRDRRVRVFVSGKDISDRTWRLQYRNSEQGKRKPRPKQEDIEVSPEKAVHRSTGMAIFLYGMSVFTMVVRILTTPDRLSLDIVVPASIAIFATLFALIAWVGKRHSWSGFTAHLISSLPIIVVQIGIATYVLRAEGLISISSLFSVVIALSILITLANGIWCSLKLARTPGNLAAAS